MQLQSRVVVTKTTNRKWSVRIEQRQFLGDLQSHSSTTSLFKCNFSTAVQQLTRFQLTLWVVRSLCDSSASCYTANKYKCWGYSCIAHLILPIELGLHGIESCTHDAFVLGCNDRVVMGVVVCVHEICKMSMYIVWCCLRWNSDTFFPSALC